MNTTPNIPQWNRIFISFGFGFLLCLLLFKGCGIKDDVTTLPNGSHTVITKIDTIWPDTQFVTVKVKIPGPTKTYTVYLPGDTIPSFTRIYRDSLKDSNLVITYLDSISGTLLGKKMSYKLFVPLKVNTTVHIIDSIPFTTIRHKNGLYLTGEIGGNLNMFEASAGADFINKKRALFGYRYGIINKTHNIRIGFRIF